MISAHKWPLMDESVNDEDRNSLADFILSNQQLTNGPMTRQFESEWSNWLGVKHSVFINSGASGNYVSIAITKELHPTRDEVIVPALGWVSDISSVTNLGLRPVFIDVDLQTFSMNQDAAISAITERTAAVVIVHGLGFVGEYERLFEVCAERDILVVEDCCEAHGARYKNGLKVGTVGNCSVFSFYYGHHMTTIEGGVVSTNDSQIANYAKMFRSHGMIRDCDRDLKDRYIRCNPDLNPLFTFAVPGFNFRNTEINAVLGLSQLKRLNKSIDSRQENLRKWLKGLDETAFFTGYNSLGSSNFALPLVLVEASKRQMQWVTSILDRLKIEYRVGTAGGGNLARQPFLNNKKFRIHGELAVVDHLHNYGLYIGNSHLDLTERIEMLHEELRRV